MKPPAGTLPIKNDTTGREQPDTVGLQPADTVQMPPPKGDIETIINYTARDSILGSMDNKMIWLYGQAKIVYGDIELEAEEIVIDYANNTISAQGARDSTGARIGYPIFKDGAEVYETKGIVYNFKTRRARIREIVTKQGEGFLTSAAAFKNEKNEIFSINNSYTTCNLEKPHFRIRATKTKAIPDDKIVAGPFFLEFNGIPIPAGFLFGMFPAQRESSSGILFPTYGDERRRGFNLRRGGYFFDISEYVKLAITGDIYSKGSHALYVNSNYMTRYAYTGAFNFSYSKNKNTDNIEDQQVTNDFAITWNHSPQSKGTGRFSASVNAATATFTKNNNIMTGAVGELTNSRGIGQLSRKLSSNVSYSKRFSGTPFSLGVNLTHNQDLVTRVVDLPLPNVTLNMTNIYPFQRKGKTGPLDNFTIGYSMAGTNRITNNLGRITPGAKTDSIAPFTIENLNYFIKNGKKGVRHAIPVTYSFKALKHFTVSPSVNYEEVWYFDKQTWRFANDSTDLKEIAKTIPGFNRIANYNFGASVATRIYGMYFFKNPASRVKAIRHIINPNFGFSYMPDFSKNTDYFQEFTERSTGRTVYQSRHLGSVYGGSELGKTGAISFGVGNNLEMKVKSSKDTVERKVMLLNNLSFGSNYNIMADSFNLAPISFAANTSILDNKININLGSSIDPYRYRVDRRGVERRTSTYAWEDNSLGRITSATLAFNTNLNPKGRDAEQETREKVAKSDLPEADKQAIIQNPNAYVDFDIPWTMNLAYSLTYSRPPGGSPRFVQTVQVSGTLSLSEKWMIRYNSGFDFEKKDFTMTNFGISRDLHCWHMALDWIPFGAFQSYNFTIAVKASILKDLKLERRKPFFDNL